MVPLTPHRTRFNLQTRMRIAVKFGVTHKDSVSYTHNRGIHINTLLGMFILIFDFKEKTVVIWSWGFDIRFDLTDLYL